MLVLKIVLKYQPPLANGMICRATDSLLRFVNAVKMFFSSKIAHIPQQLALLVLMRMERHRAKHVLAVPTKMKLGNQVVKNVQAVLQVLLVRQNVVVEFANRGHLCPQVHPW